MTVKKESWHTGYQSTEKAGIVLLELPALEEMVISKGILPGITHVYLVCRANRVWNKMDKELISLFKQVIPLPLMPLLNGVSIDFAEDYIGEVTKRRTGIRSMFKRLVKFEFGNRKRIR
jgi:hypothetical protein